MCVVQRGDKITTFFPLMVSLQLGLLNVDNDPALQNIGFNPVSAFMCLRVSRYKIEFTASLSSTGKIPAISQGYFCACGNCFSEVQCRMRTFVTGGCDKCHIRLAKWYPKRPCGAESLPGLGGVSMAGRTADRFEIPGALLAGGSSAGVG